MVRRGPKKLQRTAHAVVSRLGAAAAKCLEKRGKSKRTSAQAKGARKKVGIVALQLSRHHKKGLY